MFILILDPKTALVGAGAGVKLCIYSVIPSLFPFFVLSGLLTGALSGKAIPLLRPLGKLCGVPEGGESILAVGLLGGYPVGAQSIAQAYSSGQLDKKTARRLLGFCSNAGPSFLFGIVAAQFSSPLAPWALWAVVLLSAMLTGALLPGKTGGAMNPAAGEISVTAALHRALHAIGAVCGWVVLFRVLTAYLEKWGVSALPRAAQTIVTGLLELTNGCCALEMIGDEKLRFTVAAGLLCFGGLCVTMQTASVTGDLGIRSYLMGKLMQTGLGVTIAWLIVGGAQAVPFGILLLALAAIGVREFEKRCSNPAKVGV